MQGLASYRRTGDRPSRPITRILLHFAVAVFSVPLIASVGCKRQPAPVEGQAPAPPAKLAEAAPKAPDLADAPATAVPADPEEERTASAIPAVAEPLESLEAEDEPEPIDPTPLPPPENAVKLSPTEEVWMNRAEQRVYVGGQVALRRGMLEMFACLKGTKEHESVVAVNSRAATIHAALLAVGAVPGTPVSFDPDYTPPTGTEIEISVEWKDPEGQWHSARGQEWVRDVRTGKELAVPWVFAGSMFYRDEETGRQLYLAESGDLICVSNFSTAMLDIPVESSQAADGLLFEAFTERVPALGTPVRLTLEPKLEESP